MERLQATVSLLPGAALALRPLPQVLRVEIRGTRIGIVHGDPASLAGWGLAIENLAPRGGTTGAETVARWAREAEVDAFACAHTCLPWAGRFGDVAVINSGSAGMPNFRGRHEGIVTRIAALDDPAPDALYAVRAGLLRPEAVPITYDRAAWQKRFLRQWPVGSPAHASYWTRIEHGPDFACGDALPLGGGTAA